MADFAVRNRESSGRMVCFEIIETDAEPTSEAGPIVFPSAGRLLRVHTTIESGSGVTVRPSGYSEPGGNARDRIFEDAGIAAAADVDDATPVPYYAPGAEFYHRSNVDAGADTVIRSLYVFERGS